jgi:hypothetical protein
MVAAILPVLARWASTANSRRVPFAGRLRSRCCSRFTVNGRSPIFFGATAAVTAFAGLDLRHSVTNHGVGNQQTDSPVNLRDRRPDTLNYRALRGKRLGEDSWQISSHRRRPATLPSCGRLWTKRRTVEEIARPNSAGRWTQFVPRPARNGFGCRSTLRTTKPTHSFHKRSVVP